SKRVATANPDFSPHKFSLLIITGRSAPLTQTAPINREIERGIQSWDIDLKSCNLNLYLQEFLSQHTASFKGAEKRQKCLRHSNRVLDTQVLISPSQEQVHSEVFTLLSRESAHKLLILAGQSSEESGDLLFHRGLFSPQKLNQILAQQHCKKKYRESSPSSSKLSLTLSCPSTSQWRKTLLGNQALQASFELHINPPEVLPAMEALGEFTSLISGTLSPPSPFDLLPPPITVGFLKLSRPCCYVFPAGRGDCAFFAVNGFTLLVDGGSDSQACFWKLVRHLDRVDAVLMTHIGTENLPGVNVFLERKVAELELSSDIKGKKTDDTSKRLISPELGVVFFNAPSGLQKSTHQAALTLQLLKKLDIRPQPLFRPQGVPIEPLTLFQKMGVGQLDLYILSPGINSQEYTLASVSALLVWHPACPQEKVVRVLFPGVTPQEKLLLGLEKLKGLAFLQKPSVTTGDMERLGEDGKTKRTENQGAGKSQGKEKTNKHGIKQENGAKRNHQGEKDVLPFKPKNENKTKLKKEAKNDSKTGVKKPGKLSGKDVNNGKKVNGNTAAKPDTAPGGNGNSSSPENQGPVSPDEQTVEPASPDSRPNSAGHTPYCLSPDDVWCNRATLSKLQAQMSNLESFDINQPDGASKQNEGQPKSNPESQTLPKERQLSFLSLGSFKEGPSDPSPSFTNTTTTTHSMPAEVSSPQSTEVDESLSMSLEHGPTTLTPGSEMGRPPAPNSLHFDASTHEVDLCLVSPCEFKHLKQPDSSLGASEPPRGAFAPHHHGNNNPKDSSPSESCAPVCTEDCPSTTADGCLDSDDNDSSSEPSNSPHNLRSSQGLPPDPLPAPLRDSPPLPPHPGTSMPVPQSESDAHRKKAKATGMRGKAPAVVEPSQRSGSGKIRTSGVQKGNVFSTFTPSSSIRSAPAKSSPNTDLHMSNSLHWCSQSAVSPHSPVTDAKSTCDGEVSVYVDLAYIPFGASSPTVSVDFFRCVRSSCYIISGDSQEKEELMRNTLDALLDAKMSWPDTMQVTLIPTFESVPMQEWYQQTLDRQKELGITVLGSNSTVAMQDETFPACKIEF
uniref:Microtubule-associated protein 1Sb n=1 Tax=Gasterosteus aculeatus TaxID=69293 RepID=G3P5M6_GASAC